MTWSSLAMQFCLELGFGVLLALAFVPKAPVGVLFYRVMGTTALVPILVALAVPLGSGELDWSDPVILAGGLSVVTYPFYSGPLRGPRWAVDYPKADQQFLVALRRLTIVDAFGSDHALGVGEASLRDFPFLYVLEVGSLSLSEGQVTALRQYLLAHLRHIVELSSTEYLGMAG